VTKILILEDSPTQSLRLKMTLSAAGYEVDSAVDGLQGLTKFSESHYDLVITDVLMPGLSGYEFCMQAKALPEKSKIPIILLTALNDPKDIIHALECRADNFITKPWIEVILLNRVKAAVANRALRETTSEIEENYGVFMGQRIHVTASKKQILDLLLSTFEDMVSANDWLRESQSELERTVSLVLKERERSDELLLNVLPRTIARRLKDNTQIIADTFRGATILFADIVGFTDFAAKKTPQEVIQFLNTVFSRFDKLVDIYGLEKIKTIGDAYMVVGGLPVLREDHATAIANLALDMQSAVAQYNKETKSDISIRIGINTGPVIAGVIGTKKFLYDLWGDTVNTASRMESQGLPNLIQVTAATYEFLQNDFVLEKRGALPVKGKGEVVTYFLKERKHSTEQTTKKEVEEGVN